MIHRIALMALIVVSSQVPLPARAGGDASIRSQTVQFAKGASSARLGGTIKGDDAVDYRVSARAGQTLSVALKTSNASNYFNVMPPGSNDVAMFIGSSSGSVARLLLPSDGVYVVRVYLMRNAARRSELGRYTLTIGVTGQALPPLPAAQDALVPGTPFHATATVPCQTPGADTGADCKAGVIRRGRDGTATVELRGARGWVRNVLFVKGEPVASDSAEPMTSSRQGDVVTVRFDGDERYEVPDALLTGG
jgi:hypothetical protein